MRPRLALTIVWLAAFLISLGLVLLHQLKGDISQAVSLNCIERLAALFSAYLAGMLGFWYLKPFPAARTKRGDSIRFWLAMVCAVVFNGMILLYVGRAHVTYQPGDPDVLDNVKAAVQIAGWLSFLVAPANLYYFGLKP